jgi:hypothetical protein
MAASAVPPRPPQPPLQPPPWRPPQQRSSNAIWWVLGIIGACIVLVMIAGLLVVSAILHRVHVNTADNKVDIRTPVGELKVDQDSEHATGLPVYPGATLEKSEGASFEVSANGKAAGLAVEKYVSDDSRDKVQDWYAKRLGPEFKLNSDTQNGKDEIPGLPVDVQTTDLAFVSKRSESTRVVALGHKDDGTEITLVRVGKKEPQ